MRSLLPTFDFTTLLIPTRKDNLTDWYLDSLLLLLVGGLMVSEETP